MRSRAPLAASSSSAGTSTAACDSCREGANDGFPEPLGDFLNEVVTRRRGLRMHVLAWDFAMVFALDREWLPDLQARLAHTPRDRRSGSTTGIRSAASHHQKIVVVDDAVAFVGGLDLTHCRWDTSAHGCDQPHRRDAEGAALPRRSTTCRRSSTAPPRAPSASCAATAGCARRASRCDPAIAVHDDPWPQHVTPDVTDVDVAIARTDPGYVTGGACRRNTPRCTSTRSHRRRRCIYIENQYFSSSLDRQRARRAPARSRTDRKCVVVSRQTEEGWLEERTMGVLRARLHKRLREADASGRYRLLYPYVPGLERRPTS